MLPSSTVENYLKALYLAQGALDGPRALVPMGQLAAALGVVPGTATTMVKALADSGLVRYEPYVGVRLTPAGEKLATMVLRRHRLIELFLVNVMGMGWAEVHDEAERLEHAVSDRLIERMDDMLGHPTVDPHGDPIPDQHGSVQRAEHDTLLTCPLKTKLVVRRVTDQDAAFLRFLEDQQLKPGETIEIELRDAAADAVRVKRRDNRRVTLGTRAASKLLVDLLAALVLVAGVSTRADAATHATPAGTAPAAVAATDDAGECAIDGVHGVVTDTTGAVLPGATVTLVGAAPNGATVTDARGTFCVGPLPEGVHRLIVALPGYRDEARDLAVRRGTRASVAVTLTPALREDVVVRPARDGRLARGVVRTEVVGADTIAALSARTLADAVEYTTGVRVESNCQNCNFSQIRLLGLEGPYTQILVDGQPVVSALAQVYGIEQIPARMIERIEVVKGGGSAIFGPGAVGGVVNVISREPARSGGAAESRVDVVSDLPSYSVGGGLDWVSPERTTLVTAFTQVDRVKPVDVTGDGFTEISRRNLNAFGARLTQYLAGNRAKLTVDGTHLSEDRRGGDRLDAPPQLAEIAEWIDTRRTAGTVSWFHAPSPRFDYRLLAATALTARDSYYGTGRDPRAFGDTSDRLFVVDAQVNRYAGAHTLSGGVQGSLDRLVDRARAYDRFTRATYRQAGAFVQDEWTFARGWQVLLGVRADRHSTLDGVTPSPRLGLMYSPRPSLDVRASFARGIRPPQVFDEDLHLSSVGGEVRVVRLADGLRPERSTSAMVGAEWKPAWGPGQALLEANVFHTALTDTFHVVNADVRSTPQVEMSKTNLGGARVRGVEFNLGWGIGDRLVLQGGIVEQRATFVDPEPDFGSRAFFRTPNRYGNVSLTWRDRRFGDLFVGGRYTGPMWAPHYAGAIPADRLERTRRFLVLDVTLARPLPRTADRLVLTFGVRNLTDAFQRDIDQGPLRDAGYVYGPRFPRSVFAGLRVAY